MIPANEAKPRQCAERLGDNVTSVNTSDPMLVPHTAAITKFENGVARTKNLPVARNRGKLDATSGRRAVRRNAQPSAATTNRINE